MKVRIALAGNPNSGKTTLFNALTGANQFVGNWPGVTVEKKEGKMKSVVSQAEEAVLVDLPGIYSLSPYTLEEVVSRNFLLEEKPDAIINIVDGTNLERNLYLTTQLTELGIPVIVAVNMMDLVRKNGEELNIDRLSKDIGCKVVEISALKGEGIDRLAARAVSLAKSGKKSQPAHRLNIDRLSKDIGCKVVEISALKGEGIDRLAARAVSLAKSGKKSQPAHRFDGCVEHALAHIEEAITGHVDASMERWYALKLFERDEKVKELLKLEQSLTCACTYRRSHHRSCRC